MDFKNALLKDLNPQDWIRLINTDPNYKDIFLGVNDQVSKKDVDCFVEVMIFHPTLSSNFKSYGLLNSSQITKLLLSGLSWDVIFKEKIEPDYLDSLNSWNVVDVLVRYPDLKKRFSYLSDLTDENRIILVTKTETNFFDDLIDYENLSNINQKFLMENKKDFINLKKGDYVKRK
jgi:hypothetical protein